MSVRLSDAARCWANRTKSILTMQDGSADLVVEALKAQWFQLATEEDYPYTPDITNKLDKLETEIEKWSNPKNGK